eukprot:m.45079 g.45079  ORF g.45079 m.45079 type:complete len:68 (-) comp15112_c0_seq3:1707-1910(-)
MLSMGLFASASSISLQNFSAQSFQQSVIAVHQKIMIDGNRWYQNTVASSPSNTADVPVNKKIPLRFI